MFQVFHNTQSGGVMFTSSELHFVTGGFVLGKPWLLHQGLQVGFLSGNFVPELVLLCKTLFHHQ